MNQQEYNPLLDKHLNNYFANKAVIKTLRRGRLINKKGEILDQSLQKQYIQYFSEFPLIKTTPVQEIIQTMKKVHIKTQQSKEKHLSNKHGSVQLTKHLNNTYLKKPEVLKHKKIMNCSLIY